MSTLTPRSARSTGAALDEVLRSRRRHIEYVVVAEPAIEQGPTPTAPVPPPSQAQSQTPDLSARLDKIERAIEAQRAEPALGNRLAALEAQAKSLDDGIAALRRRVEEIAATGQSAAKQADSALNTAEVAKSASEAATKMEVQRSDLDAVSSRIVPGDRERAVDLRRPR